MEHANESSNHKINVKHVGQTGDDETRVTSLGQSKNIIQIIQINFNNLQCLIKRNKYGYSLTTWNIVDRTAAQ